MSQSLEASAQGMAVDPASIPLRQWEMQNSVEVKTILPSTAINTLSFLLATCTCRYCVIAPALPQLCILATVRPPFRRAHLPIVIPC